MSRDSDTLHQIWEKSRGSKRPATVHAVPVGSEDLQKLLGRLCDLKGISNAERHAVLTHQALMIDGVSLALKLEEWSGYVKIFVDIGLPAPGREQETYRYLLEQQLYMPAPFSMVPALHPASGHIVLTACAPLPGGEDSDMAFLGLLQACVAAAQQLALPSNP